MPSRHDPGGVAGYYNSVWPYLNRSANTEVIPFEIGHTHGNTRILHRMTDQIRFWVALRRVKPDLVHVNPSLNLKSVLRDGLFIQLAKVRGHRVLVFFRGWETAFEARLSGPFLTLFRQTYQQADAIIVLASAFRERLRHWGIKVPIHIQTTAVNDQLLQNFSLEKKLTRIRASEELKILFLSRLEKEKGIFETIEAITLLLQKGVNLNLSIAGTGSIAKKINTEIVNRGLSGRVSLLGYVTGKRKAQVFTDHDIYCFPTYHDEGMANSVLEAMALGLAIITTPKGGVKDFFKTEQMGYMCRTIAPTEISKHILKLYRNPEVLCRIATHNHHFARNNFMASATAQQLLKLYHDCMAAPAAR